MDLAADLHPHAALGLLDHNFAVRVSRRSSGPPLSPLSRSGSLPRRTPPLTAAGHRRFRRSGDLFRAAPPLGCCPGSRESSKPKTSAPRSANRRELDRQRSSSSC
jgi:hypothetical protein